MVGVFGIGINYSGDFMTDENKKKRMRVFTIIESKDEGKKDYWQDVGMAFENKDGSINVLLNALPVNGTLHIRQDSEERKIDIASE